MHILLISRCPPWPLYLGDRLIVYHLAEELEARKHELDLLAFADRAEDFQEQDKYDHLFNQVQLFKEPPRSQLSYLKRLLIPSWRFPTRAEQSWSPDMWRAIETQLATNHYDAIHLFGGVQVYEFYGALGGRKAIITPYESFSLYLRRVIEQEPHSLAPTLTTFAGSVRQQPQAVQIPTPNPSPSPVVTGEGRKSNPGYELGLSPTKIVNRIQFQIARRFESFMFMPYKETIVVSERDRDELVGINPVLKVIVIPNGVDTYVFRPRPVKRIPAVLFVGNYEYAPNVDAALRLATEIFPAVQARVPQVRLWLVGNAPPPELTTLASDSIRVTGRVPDVRPYLARASAFVSPLRLGAGIKNKVLEALAMGCPVVATPISLDGIAVRDGQEVLAADGAMMIDGIVRLLQDEGLRTTLSTNGRKLIESHYSWDHVAQQYEDLYKRLSGNR